MEGCEDCRNLRINDKSHPVCFKARMGWTLNWSEGRYEFYRSPHTKCFNPDAEVSTMMNWQRMDDTCVAECGHMERKDSRSMRCVCVDGAHYDHEAKECKCMEGTHYRNDKNTCACED